MKSKHKEERTNFSERIRRKENSFWVPFSFIFILYDSKILFHNTLQVTMLHLTDLCLVVFFSYSFLASANELHNT